MAKDLWQLRERRGMKVGKLAAKSGVPAKAIVAYEAGEPVKMAHLSRLAKALYVDEMDIKQQSAPRPGESRAKPKTSKKRNPPQIQQVQSPEGRPARPSQITYLLQLAEKLELDEGSVAKTIGKPLAELSEKEASTWLNHYIEEWKKVAKEEEDKRPANTRRRRAHLPEGVDEFELNYLEARQRAEDRLTFTLINGESFNGRITGFSPYQITIQQDDGTEITLQKLALAYYTLAGNKEKER